MGWIVLMKNFSPMKKAQNWLTNYMFLLKHRIPSGKEGNGARNCQYECYHECFNMNVLFLYKFTFRNC